MHLKLVCIKFQIIQKNKSKFKRPFMVIMASVLVSKVEKLELQRDPSQRDLKIHSNYRNF